MGDLLVYFDNALYCNRHTKAEEKEKRGARLLATGRVSWSGRIRFFVFSNSGGRLKRNGNCAPCRNWNERNAVRAFCERCDCRNCFIHTGSLPGTWGLTTLGVNIFRWAYLAHFQDILHSGLRKEWALNFSGAVSLPE